LSERGKGKSGADRRLDERVPTQIRVRLKYPDVETFLERYATNISRGGIFIQTQRTKPPGTLIRFEFQLQDASPVIRGEGRVSWVVAYDSAHAERAYGMGVKFTRLDARSKSFIDRIVEQKVRRGQTDNPNAPPPPEEARLGPVRDVSGQDPTTPPRGTPPPATEAGGAPLSAAPPREMPDVLTPVLPTDVEELLAAAPAIEMRALAGKILGPVPHDRAALVQLLDELDAAVAASGRPARRPTTARRSAATRARREPAPAAARIEARGAEPEAPAPAEPGLQAVPPAGVAAEESTTPTAQPPAEAEARVETAGAPAAAEVAAAAVDVGAPAESVDERIDRLLDGASPGSFALDLEEMPEPPPLESALARRTPAPGRRTPAPPHSPRRRSERALFRPEVHEAEPEPAAEPRVGESPAIAAAWEAAAVAPDATEPSMQVPLDTQFGVTPDLTPAFGDTAGAATVESPPDITPPGAQAVTVDVPAAEAEAASLLGMDDPFGLRGDEDPFSMDVGPMLEDAEGGAQAERTVIGGAAFRFGTSTESEAVGVPVGEQAGLEVTATHPPMPTAEGDEEVGFFEGDIGDVADAEVPPDAGALVGMPELDEPLVDDFEAPAADAPLLGADLAETPRGGSPAALAEEVARAGAGLDDGFVFAETALAEALPEDEQNKTMAGEPMPELLIDEGLLDSSGSEEVTARQSPLPPEPDDPDQPKKGFFRKLFRNK